MTFNIKTIAIAGAGTMGNGIAQVAATAGYKTILYDINAEMLKTGENAIKDSLSFLVKKERITLDVKENILNRIFFTSNINDVIADFIIEAIVENLDIKHQLLNSLASINSTTTIIASNTSSIPITQIAAKIPHPERVIGVHFFNPAPIMKLVEIISGAKTSPEVASFSKKVIEEMGKTCVFASDAPGFIVNRVARHFYVEGLLTLEEKVANHEVIDELIQSCGFKMGPFKLMDLIGVDANLNVTKSIYQLFNLDSKFKPNRIQQQKVDAGFHGKKSKEGFYKYEN
jgi:3-hydroxybutyryl-CoA dehydrogenase